jgi:hypothetical protein
LEDLVAEVEINSVWETIRENAQFSAKDSLGYYELKKHKGRKGIQNYQINRNTLNCSGYKIPMKKCG